MLDHARLRALMVSLQQRAQPAVVSDRVALLIGGSAVGSAEASVAALLAREVPRLTLRGGELVLDDAGCDFAARSALLAQAALHLRRADLLPGWRDELLAVSGPDGEPLAAIERAACRPLGITTSAVHLNGYADETTLVVTQRSLHKQIDPGLWDNLVGGMVPAGESLEQALKRESWEEVGLALNWQQVTRGRRFHLRRALPEGLQSEVVYVFDAPIGAEIVLENQDGEVGAIERRPLAAVVAAIEREEFTLEAALATLESLARRAGVEPPAGLYV